MRQLLVRILRRMVRMAMAYPPVFAAVRDFLRDNPEALFKMVEGEQFSRALLAQNHAMLSMTRTKRFWHRFASNPQYQNQLVKGMADTEETTRVDLIQRLVDSNPSQPATKPGDYVRSKLVRRLLSDAPEDSILFRDEETRSSIIRKLLNKWQLPKSLFESVPISVVEDPGFRERLVKRSSALMSLAELVGELPDNLLRSRFVAKLLRPSTTSQARARMLSALAFELAGEKGGRPSRTIYDLFAAWETIGRQLDPDWLRKTDLYNDLGSLKGLSVTDRLSHLIENVSDNGQVKLSGGTFKYLDPRSFAEVVDEILVHEPYFFKSEVEEPYVLDCGVNSGLAIYYVKQHHPNARIVGFEPYEPLANLARENVEQLGLSNVTIYTAALAGTEGELPFLISDNPLAHQLVDPDTLEVDDKSVNVKAEVLSKYVTERVDFLKLDIEGGEYDVLHELGMDRLRRVMNLFCEYHIRTQDDWIRFAEVLKLLRNTGFQLHIESATWAQRSRSYRGLTQTGKSVSISIFASRDN